MHACMCRTDMFHVNAPAGPGKRRVFPDFCRSVVDIMNSDDFILEVPAELRMRRSRRRKDDIMEIDAVVEG